MKSYLIILVFLISSAHVFSQEVETDTLSVMNYNTFEEMVKVYPKVTEGTDGVDETADLIARFGGLSISLLDNEESAINRDSLLMGLETGLKVIHQGSVFIEKTDCEKIEIINSDGIIVRTITGMLGIMPEEIKPFLKMADRAKISGFSQVISLNGENVPLELSFKLK